MNPQNQLKSNEMCFEVLCFVFLFWDVFLSFAGPNHNWPTLLRIWKAVFRIQTQSRSLVPVVVFQSLSGNQSKASQVLLTFWNLLTSGWFFWDLKTNANDQMILRCNCLVRANEVSIKKWWQVTSKAVVNPFPSQFSWVDVLQSKIIKGRSNGLVANNNFGAMDPNNRCLFSQRLAKKNTIEKSNNCFPNCLCIFVKFHIPKNRSQKTGPSQRSAWQESKVGCWTKIRLGWRDVSDHETICKPSGFVRHFRPSHGETINQKIRVMWFL